MRASGVRAEVTTRHTVQASDLATSWGNNVPVLATPVVLWWAELATMQAMSPAYGPGEMCVGAGHDDVRHLGASLEGHRVTVTARLLDTDATSAGFAVSATDGERLVFRTVHVRAVVDRARFEAGLDRLATPARCCDLARSATTPSPGPRRWEVAS